MNGENEKMELLLKLKKYEDRGYRVNQRFSMSSDIDEIRFEVALMEKKIELEKKTPSNPLAIFDAFLLGTLYFSKRVDLKRDVGELLKTYSENELKEMMTESFQKAFEDVYLNRK